MRGIIEGYAVALEDRDTDRRGIQAIIAVADIKRAWRYLNLQERDLLLAHGILGLNGYEAGAVLGKSRRWVDKHYAQAIVRLTDIMNGDV